MDRHANAIQQMDDKSLTARLSTGSEVDKVRVEDTGSGFGHPEEKTSVEHSSDVDPPSQDHTSPETGTSRRRNTKFAPFISLIADQWFLITLGILIAIASQVQVPLQHQEQKRTVSSYLCISIIFFVTGCTIDTKILIQNYARWKIHLYVQIMCFAMTSLVVFGLVSAVATNHSFMDPGLLVGLIFFSCVATTISSNVVMTRQAHGNTPLTVVQVTICNLLGVFITPALVVGYTSIPTWYNAVLPAASGQWQETYRRVLKQLGLSIYLPLVVGQLARYFFPGTCTKIFQDWKLNKIGSICLLVLLWATYDQAFATHSFDRVPASNMIFIVFISVALWILFFGVTFLTGIVWLPREDVVALCMCIPAKGIVMGVPLSTTIFAGIDLGLQSKIQIPIVIYQGLQLAFASVLVPVFRRWVDGQKQQGLQGEEQGSEAPDTPIAT